eukprot:SAG31_NODE_3884_length_3784_cov_2.194030_3_plen_227_part_00
MICREIWLVDGKQSKFQNVFAGMYWTLVTVTGVGYGDMVPLSVPGKFATFVTILSGLILIALPVSIIGGNFAAVYNEFNRKEIRERYRAVGAAAAFALGGVRRRRVDHSKRMKNHEKDAQSSVNSCSAQTAIDPEDLSSGVPANDVCAGLYMEHLLRCVQHIDTQMIDGVDQMVAEHFSNIMMHVHKFTLPSSFIAEGSEWNSERWKRTGAGVVRVLLRSSLARNS